MGIQIYPATNGASGAMEVIAETVVGAGGVASIDFTLIPATYRHLRIEYLGRTDEAAVTTNLGVTINSDTAANYDWAKMEGAGTSTNHIQTFADTSAVVAGLIAGSVAADHVGVGSIDIPHYAGTDLFKGIYGSNRLDRVGVTIYTREFSGFWRSTSAINQITVTPTSGNIVEGSVFTLYGMKGA